MLIAIVDDDSAVLKALERLLCECGYDVVLFPSAEKFLKYTEADKVGCLLVDIGLGGISGLEMMRQLSASGFKRPFIFMSGRADEHIEREGVALGCVAFLHKPFLPDELLSVIQRKVAWADQPPARA